MRFIKKLFNLVKTMLILAVLAMLAFTYGPQLMQQYPALKEMGQAYAEFFAPPPSSGEQAAPQPKVRVLPTVHTSTREVLPTVVVVTETHKVMRGLDIVTCSNLGKSFFVEPEHKKEVCKNPSLGYEVGTPEADKAEKEYREKHAEITTRTYTKPSN